MRVYTYEFRGLLGRYRIWFIVEIIWGGNYILNFTALSRVKFVSCWMRMYNAFAWGCLEHVIVCCTRRWYKCHHWLLIHHILSISSWSIMTTIFIGVCPLSLVIVFQSIHIEVLSQINEVILFFHCILVIRIRCIAGVRHACFLCMMLLSHRHRVLLIKTWLRPQGNAIGVLTFQIFFILIAWSKNFARWWLQRYFAAELL